MTQFLRRVGESLWHWPDGHKIFIKILLFKLKSALVNVVCLDSQDESVGRCDTGGLVIKFLSKY